VTSRPLPDFYGVFSEQHGKPLAITETAAFFAPMGGGEDEGSIKRLWWQQVLSEDIRSSLPSLKMINWFEWRKYETEVGRDVDWRVTGPRLVDEFRRALPSFLRFADDIPNCR
jgi:hypothetical protein